MERKQGSSICGLSGPISELPAAISPAKELLVWEICFILQEKLHFSVGIHISADIDNEFLEAKYTERWRAEPASRFSSIIS